MTVSYCPLCARCVYYNGCVHHFDYMKVVYFNDDNGDHTVVYGHDGDLLKRFGGLIRLERLEKLLVLS